MYHEVTQEGLTLRGPDASRIQDRSLLEKDVDWERACDGPQGIIQGPGRAGYLTSQD